MNRIVHLSDNLRLSYAEYGNHDGFPMLIQHGMIASISDGELFGNLIDRGFRVICIARPGYGDSSVYRMNNMNDWGRIISEWSAILGIKTFDVFGISSGSSYAYSIMHECSHRVKNSYILSGVPALYDASIQKLWPFEITPELSIEALQDIARKVFFPGLQDKKSLQNDEKDSFKNNCFGIAQDLKLRCNDWGFMLEEINGEITIQHSKYDGNAPFVTAELTAKKIKKCNFIIKESSDHFSKDLMNEFIEEHVVFH
jgi:pimeloyl-ACP methyl ester carboxylesterase